MSKESRIVLVCGGRTFGVVPDVTGFQAKAAHDARVLAGEQYQFLMDTLDREHSLQRITHIIHGDAKGADRLAGEWAQQTGVQEVKCPAAWSMFGTKAGALRNHAMLELRPDEVIAFPGGTGTAHMVHSARTAGIPVMEIK